MVGTNVTIRMSEEELARLDELARRMNRTRSDVIRDLITRFDEMLREEVEKERRRWMMIGFVAALESEILDPEVVLRFVRRNVDVLGFPDFLVGMVRVRNRVVLFSHHDKIGNQLLQLVRSKVEEDVRREEAEIEREEGGDEDSEGGGGALVSIRVSKPARPDTVRAAPVATNYKLVSSNRAMPPTAKPTATSTVDRPVVGNGGGSAKAAVAASVSKNQKSGSTGIPTTHNSATTQAKGSGPQASAGGGGMDPIRPVGGRSMEKPAGDFVFALITNLYHKHRDALLKAVEGVMGG